MILCDSCQTKSCDKILSYNVLSCNDFIPPSLNVKVGDVVWVMMKYRLTSWSVVFMPCKLYITSMNATTLFCGNGSHRRKLNKAEYKTIFFLTKEECIEVCDICTRKLREQNAM